MAPAVGAACKVVPVADSANEVFEALVPAADADSDAVVDGIGVARLVLAAVGGGMPAVHRLVALAGAVPP